ncbi:FlgK family flagellar hook-associated protein [Jannaschia donghaensis]|uniref:Flagellar hook-associated protein 1 n=1 Tax=Jannaschia donghaensis TaxID=420998 RepID=A0A0M6YH65_9RHOB|nr:flagellar basal body rod C-terminal domain-containing protein [Jannaschia donghaensis]CTQ49698.1 Flagellar hook-associated protein 1 [Jannaschia donghaensis]
MSLSSSLNVAVAGLDLSARRAETVAQNVANSDRAGYARRELEVGGPSVGSPGSTSSVSRDVDPRLTAFRRESQSRQAGDEVTSSFFGRIDAAIGDPDKTGSLQDRLARLDAAFVAGAAEPQSQVRLQEIAEAAVDLSTLLNDLDDGVTEARQNADQDIGKAVTQLNSDLADVARLNTDIRRQSLGGHNTADLMDQRTVLIDRVSLQIPLRELPRDDGSIALVSSGGVMLLDGRPAELGFSSRAPLTPEMSFPTQLSGLTVNGRAVAVSGGSSGIPGGGLAALFDLRDITAPDATARLDSLAADLIDRFEDPAVDPTRAAAAPGLFTESGGILAATPDAGLAGRIGVNTLVLPSAGGDVWRLRDGLGAAVLGAGGEAGLLLRYGTAMADRAPPALAGLPDNSTDIVGHAAALKSMFSADRLKNEDRLAFSAAEAQGLVDRRDGGAVDVDDEMRRLIEIEQAYAANARIIQAVSDMMNRLTEI